MIAIPTPPSLRGTQEQQIASMRSYLAGLAELLEVELNRINYSSFDAATQEMIISGGAKNE